MAACDEDGCEVRCLLYVGDDGKERSQLTGLPDQRPPHANENVVSIHITSFASDLDQQYNT